MSGDRGFMNFTYMKDFMKHFVDMGVPGNTVRVWQNHKEIFSHSEGYSDKEEKVAMTGDELFNIYSCSKVATVTAALQLYERGEFLLDTPIYEFIPEYREMFINDKEGNLIKAKNAITMRHLFTMTAGFSYDKNTEGFRLAREKTNGKMDTVETIKCMATDPLGFEPGTKWRYSLCHDVLGGVVEVISGKKFSKYVTENIFKPLGMNESYYRYSDEIGEKMASHYRFIEENEEYRNISDFQAKGSSTVGHTVKIEKDRTMDYGIDIGMDLGMEYMPENMEETTTETGFSANTVLSSVPAMGGITAAVLVLGVVLGIVLAKRKIKKGFDWYED